MFFQILSLGKHRAEMRVRHVPKSFLLFCKNARMVWAGTVPDKSRDRHRVLDESGLAVLKSSGNHEYYILYGL